VKIIIAPDKFKGSLTSLEACNAIRNGLLHDDHGMNIILLPMADGGDGFSSVLKHYLGSVTVELPSVDAIGRQIISAYEWQAKDETAIIEIASCSGIAILKENERDPLGASTYGTGLQIKHAIENGASKILLGLGGSATTDAGTGILSALGFSFLDINDRPVQPSGETLLRIQKITNPPTLPKVRFQIATDVTNPMFGPMGAAHIFAPQKGATGEEVDWLNKGLEQFAKVLKKETGNDVAQIAGTGAAGGIAAALLSYFPASIIKGMDVVMSASGIEKEMRDADLVITGEGKLDRQSFDGKTVGAIAALANTYSVPCICLCGKLELTEQQIKQMGLLNAFSISEGLNVEESIDRAAEYLELRSRTILSQLPELIKNKK
jgi:glycerate kinase